MCPSEDSNPATSEYKSEVLLMSQISQYKTEKVCPNLRYTYFESAFCVVLYTALVLVFVISRTKLVAVHNNSSVISITMQSHKVIYFLPQTRICFVKLYEKAICDTNWIADWMH
jgi:hypothetical protein